MLEQNNSNIDLKDILNKTKVEEKVEVLPKSQKPKFRYFLIGVLLGLVIISVTYLVSKKSNVKEIIVNGNVYLKDDDIINQSGLSVDDKYVFVNPSSAENSILKNPLVDECTVSKCDDQSIEINVVEKKIIGYSFEDNENVLILANDSRIVLDKKNLYLIGKAPLIEGFEKDDILLIERNLSSVDYRTLNEVSEIHFFPELKFQNHELIMRDGNYIFTSVYGLKVLNEYYDIVSSYDGQGNNCYYVEDISGNVYISACPWETNDEENKETDQEDKIEDDEIEED